MEKPDIRGAQPLPTSERIAQMRARAERRKQNKFMSSERIRRLLEYGEEVTSAANSIVAGLEKRLVEVAEAASQKGIRDAELISRRLDHLSRVIDAFAERRLILQEDERLASEDPKIHVYTAQARFEGEEYWVEIEIQPRAGSRKLEVASGLAEETEPGCEFRLIPQKDSLSAIAVRLDSETRKVVHSVKLEETGGRELLLSVFGKGSPSFDTDLVLDNEQFARAMEVLNLWVRTPGTES